ncbi:hypothetical protein AGMMS50239_10890 [Bacteroidia bacterium]|nr:hypothetical protein AGMMS50239_10890 [Bacteroidia bacterium]
MSKLKKMFLTALLWAIFVPVISAFQPVKVDLNYSGRSLNETNELGYLSWVVKAGISDTLQLKDGIKIILTAKNGSLITNWHKAGNATAKLVSDGVLTEKIPESGENAIELKIQGLNKGEHSILTYHNRLDDPKKNTFAPMDIYFNRKPVVTNLQLTTQVKENTEAAKYYQKFNVTGTEDIIFEFKSVAGSYANIKSLIINAFELDTNDPDKQAILPTPLDGDEHADADNKTLKLSWTPAKNAVSHQVYFGKDFRSVENAGKNSPEFKGSQTGTDFEAKDLYSMDTYYWRVDEVDAKGEVTKGNTWYFRPRQLAFNGAEGYGRFARGGRGGIVVKVTNLNDKGPGSLRDALENPAYEGIPRTIIFDVSGRIALIGRLSVNKPYITIAGQTAPGKGICLSGQPFGVGGSHDVIFRHLRLRVGSEATTDGMGQSGADHCIIDHASISWSKDEATSSRNGKNITFQRTLISEPLNRAGHKNYKMGSTHGFAGSIGGEIGSYHHNLLAHSYGRNWSLAGGLDASGFYKGKIDIFNNVIYNWGNRTTDGGAHEVNFVANYYKPGVETIQKYALNAQWDGFPGTQKYYCSGNIVEGYFEDLSNPRNGCRSDENNPDPWSDKPFFPSYATIHTAKDAYKQVLSDVGANQPLFDDHDIRIVKETLDGSWTYRGSYDAPNGSRGVIDHPDDAGGWEDYGNETRPANYDSDNDGLPDWWETAVSHTNPDSPQGDFSDSNADPDKNGFTCLDDFLDWMANPHYISKVSGKNNSFNLDLKVLTKGYTASPKYKIDATENCSVKLDTKGVAKISPAVAGNQLSSITFTVTDSEGSSMTRKIGLFFAPAKILTSF